jgi:glycosyltransferase involved in cell wall biosynthesis
VVEVKPEEIPEKLGPSLVVTAITKGQRLINRLVASPHVDRLNIGPIPTMRISWDQPREGNLFEHLYARRAFSAGRGCLMKILYITAGAAGMYCGSCLRDNALAAELMAQGHEVTLVPLYTPTLTDEPNVSQEKVLFGGISVYLQQHSALFRHTPRLLDRLWDSSLALKAAARRSISVDPHFLAEMTVSMLKGERGHQHKELFKLLDWLRHQHPPDIVTLPNSLLIALAAPIKRALNRLLCCTLQGEDLFLEGMLESHRSQALELIRASVQHVDAFIAVSHFYADFMSDYLHIPRQKIHVVPLGINLEGYDAGRREDQSRSDDRARLRSDHFTIGYFARVAPEKGLHILCEAYRRLRQRGELPHARLEAAGYLAPEHKAYLHGLEQQMKDAGLGDEFHYRGVLDRESKLEFFRRLDVFSMPATYAEPKGMSALEAMASGVPVVQPRWGAFPEILEKTAGGILVEPNDSRSLAEGILSLWKNPEWADDLGRRGAAGVRQHYSVARMADRALEVYGNLLRPASRAREDTALTAVGAPPPSQ